jgi:hypothetical protein
MRPVSGLEHHGPDPDEKKGKDRRRLQTRPAGRAHNLRARQTREASLRAIVRAAILGLALAAFAAATSVSAQTEAVGLGTWKLNIEKSKFSPAPPPRSFTVKFEAAGNGVKVTGEGIDAGGKPFANEYTASYDGKEVPYKGSAMIDTISMRRIDARTTVRTDKKDGKVVQTLTRVVAEDGKSFTATTKGTNAKGEQVTSVLVWEKV